MSAAESRRRRFVAFVAGAALLAFAGLLVLPALRTWTSQRDQRTAAERKLAFLQSENAKLEQRVRALQTPEQIEQVARAQYNFAYPGEQVVSVLPAPVPGPFPATWPYNVVQAIVTARAG